MKLFYNLVKLVCNQNKGMPEGIHNSETTQLLLQILKCVRILCEKNMKISIKSNIIIFQWKLFQGQQKSAGTIKMKHFNTFKIKKYLYELFHSETILVDKTNHIREYFNLVILLL